MTTTLVVGSCDRSCTTSGTGRVVSDVNTCCSLRNSCSSVPDRGRWGHER